MTGLTPAPVTAVINYEVFTVRLPESCLPLTGAIELDGSATFTLSHL